MRLRRDPSLPKLPRTPTHVSVGCLCRCSLRAWLDFHAVFTHLTTHTCRWVSSFPLTKQSWWMNLE